ncbi:imidazole glycerol phosphate synthase subunit HisF [Moheibacter sediminis]|uniref:Imidazole glycerol phosphate synthase subunit HisF n=1 Tax=Moheibacter sediminis TaxID=1434700 RepID=A0A1W1ZC96_9FLAO|nr:imidazole glycerol phosphate synthase subunit HisF [Moheibacter sediminis]SMC45821.1 cyclase [Moheibacter sediminis]
MLKKRIIPCLDIKNGRVVKGINFEGIKDAGDPIELAQRYVKEGADELVFLDITATLEKRKILCELVSEIASEINIPFTVGGGINSLEDAKMIINSGADKISINSSAIQNPKLIAEIVNEFGSQCVVLAIDTKFVDNQWIVFRNGGNVNTQLNALEWAEKGVELGAGEILLTSMNNDGTQSGFALEITQQVSEKVSVPVIASGGAGKKQDFAEVFEKSKATGALAASVFHFGQIPIPELKEFLNKQNIPVRI